MDNKILIERDDSVGTDPSVVSVIETLDVTPNDAPQKRKKQVDPNQKKSSPVKSFFILLIAALLIGGVGYGVYFYLHLGSSNDPGKIKHAIEDKTLYIGEEIPKNIKEYTSIPSSEISSCSLDISKVNANKAGYYSYTITCDKGIYEGKIKMLERVVLPSSGNIVYKEANSSYEVSEFVKSDKEYKYAFKNENLLKEKIKKAGLYPVEIIVKDDDKEMIIYSALMVYEKNPFMSLTCIKDNITDRISFDDNRSDINSSIRIYEKSFQDEKELFSALSNISDGKIKLDDYEGYPVTNITDKKIMIIQNLTKDVLDKEYGSSFPSSYSDINNYYRNIKEYNCSI